MDSYILFLTVIGLAALAMVWMPAITEITGISYSIFFVIAGAVIYYFFGSHLPDPLPEANENLTLHFTEVVVLISLMGTGIKIDRGFSFKNWATPLKLVSVTMLLSIALAAIIGYYFIGLDLASSVLLGAVLAPTDPVLASDVQVGPPNEKVKSETKFSLTAEAGLNDGVAFPFTWLAITLAATAAGTSGGNLIKWFSYDLLYKILIGIIIGYFLGKAAGHIVFRLSKKYKFLETTDGFLAISLTLLVYGFTELVHGYGFISVFMSAITLRHFEKEHRLHDHLHLFTDQVERLLVAVILIVFGGALASGVLDVLSWKMVGFSFLFLFVIRPIAAFLSVMNINCHWKEKFAISFFGIRGMGSIYYMAFAFTHAQFTREKDLWAVVCFTILISILIHGITATSIMKHLKNNIPKEKIPT